MAQTIFISRHWPLKTVILSVLLFLASFNVLAEQWLEHGILQAYWKAQWSDNAAINVPALEFRYYLINEQGELNKVINVHVNGSQKEQLEFIRQNFSNIPENFIKYREWYITQPGRLLVNQVAKYVECQHDSYSALFIAFTPSPATPLLDMDKLASRVPCNGEGRYPWLTAYHLRQGRNNVEFKEWPDDNANNTYSVLGDDTLVKIHTINRFWIYAAVYDESKGDRLGEKRGYIRVSNLQPDN